MHSSWQSSPEYFGCVYVDICGSPPSGWWLMASCASCLLSLLSSPPQLLLLLLQLSLNKWLGPWHSLYSAERETISFIAAAPPITQPYGRTACITDLQFPFCRPALRDRYLSADTSHSSGRALFAIFIWYTGFNMSPKASEHFAESSRKAVKAFKTASFPALCLTLSTLQ